MVRRRAAYSRANDSTKYQARSNQADHVGFNVKLSDDNRHRHAEDENDVTIEQCAPGR